MTFSSIVLYSSGKNYIAYLHPLISTLQHVYVFIIYEGVVRVCRLLYTLELWRNEEIIVEKYMRKDKIIQILNYSSMGWESMVGEVATMADVWWSLIYVSTPLTLFISLTQSACVLERVMSTKYWRQAIAVMISILYE